MQTTSTQQWSVKIAAWQHSGMKIAAWCRENSENYHRFLYWRRRLAKPATGSFLELTLPAAVTSPSNAMVSWSMSPESSILDFLPTSFPC